LEQTKTGLGFRKMLAVRGPDGARCEAGHKMRLSGAEKRMRFLTDDGVEVPAVTADQMREIDRIAVQETGPTLFQMMENAGRSLASLAMELLGGGWQTAAILVVGGGGGNGGGGICAARHLANRKANVALCLATPAGLGQVPAFQFKVYQSSGGRQIAASEIEKVRPDLILDALIGYGLRSAPGSAVAELIDWCNATAAPILALDIPSGLDATTGEAPGAFIRARWTMTLALPKTGLLPQRTGELFLADIGIPQATYHRLNLPYVAPFGNRFWIRLHAKPEL